MLTKIIVAVLVILGVASFAPPVRRKLGLNKD